MSDIFRPEAGLEELLEIAGRKYTLEFAPVSAAGVSLEILQIADMRERLDAAVRKGRLDLESLPLWAKIWPASLILGHALRHLEPAERRVLEVGAGCGVAGLIAAGLGFGPVRITDINEDALLFCRINVLKNGLQNRVTVSRLDIAKDRLEERFDLILAAEVLYLEPLYRPLLKFFARHLKADVPVTPGVSDANRDSTAPSEPAPKESAPEIWLSTDHRRDARRFFKLAEPSFQIDSRPLGARGLGENDREKHLIMLHRLRKKAMFSPIE